MGIGAAATAHDASAQTVRDHRTGRSAGAAPRAPSPTPAAPPPPVNAPPPTLPGEFAFQNGVSKQYLSAAGSSLAMAPTRGANEKFRIVMERGTSFARIQAPSGAFVTSASGTPRPRASLTYGGTLFDFRFESKRFGPIGGGYYTSTYALALKDAPTWWLQQDADTAGIKPTLSAWNMGNNARALFSITKCGDLGPSAEYALRVVGASASSSPQRLLRQADGKYAIAPLGSRTYWSARGGGGNAPGKGSDGYPIETVDSIGPDAKFTVLDQGDCTYAIQTAKGWYFGMKSGVWDLGASFSTRISDPNAAPSIGYTAYWELVPTSL